MKIFRKMNVAGWREAEDRIDRLLDKNPEAAYEVWINEKLAYRVSQEEKKIPNVGRSKHL